jgi:hypothetical protein
MTNNGNTSANKVSTFPRVIETSVSWGPRTNQADDYRAIVNPESGKVFSIVSKGYKLIRHEEAVDKLEKILPEFPDLGGFNINTDFYDDGARMRRTYQFYDQKVLIKKGDAVSLNLHLFNSYDTSWPFILLLGAFRFVCANGLVVGKKFLHLRKRHVYELENIEIKKELKTAVKRFNRQTRQWQTWADQPLAKNHYQRIMKAMKFGRRASEEIDWCVSWEAEGIDSEENSIITIWLFYNIITQYITHRTVSLNHRVELERRLRNAMAKVK